MLNDVKKIIISLIGTLFLVIGIIFIILPGPAIIFIPTGLAILSTEYDWAKVWLKKSQIFFRQSAQKADNTFRYLRNKLMK